MNEFFSSILCLVNLFLLVAAGAMLRWTRRHVREMRARLERVEGQLAQIHGEEPGRVQQLADVLMPPSPAPAPVIPPKATSAVRLTAPVIQPAAERISPIQPASAEPGGSDEAQVIERDQPTPAPWTQNPLIAWFVRIHLMVQVGMIVLFFGVGFLVKYAVDQGWFPLEMRLASAALLGVGLALVGWRVRERQRPYGLALIGGGIGIVYLTTFGAYFFYGLLPALLAFTIFVLLSLLYALMALWNDAPILAFLAIVGAFLAPFLASDGGGNHVVLFSYYAIVNAGVLALAWYKAWPGLNLVSFGFSLLAGVAWAATAYRPEDWGSVEFFLALFFGFYLMISVWSALRTTWHRAEPGSGEVMLLFATPLATFVLQSLLVAEQEYWLAYTAFVFAALYLLLGLFGQWRQVADFYSQVFFFFAGFFLLIGIPLRFDARLTAAFWAVQGLGQLWIGARRQRTWLQLWGTFVQLLAGGAFLLDFLSYFLNTPLVNLSPFINHLYLGSFILSLAAIASATLVRRNSTAGRPMFSLLAYALLLLGLFWWYAGGMGQFVFYMQRADRLALLLLFMAVSGVLGEGYGTVAKWRVPRYTLFTVLPAATLVALYMFAWQYHPFAYGWYVWPVILAVHLLLLWRWRPFPIALYHAGGVWLIAFLLTWWVVQQTDRYGLTGAWAALALLLIPTIMLVLIGVLHQRMPWPIAGNHAAYASIAALPLVIYLIATTLWVNFTNTGASTPVPFVPFLNLLDLLLVGVIVALWQWSRRLRAKLPVGPFAIVDTIAKWGTWIISFLVLNMAIARSIHYLNGVPFTFTALYNSAIVQTTYALFWGLLALTLMYIAHHRNWRHVWIIGATLLGLTILKLFLVDLAHTGSLARIISFMSVGLLTIIVAYFWPAPPRELQRLQIERV